MHHKDEPKMQLLVYEPDANTCDLLNLFVQRFVFVQQNYGMFILFSLNFYSFDFIQRKDAVSYLFVNIIIYVLVLYYGYGIMVDYFKCVI